MQACSNCILKPAKQHQLRLDEGLSNFAIDKQKDKQKANQPQSATVYYLDDDTYLWDKHVMLSQMLGVYLRSLTWLQDDVASQLGHIIRLEIQTLYGENQNTVVLSEQLRGIFLSNKQQQQALEKLRIALITDNPQNERCLL